MLGYQVIQAAIPKLPNSPSPQADTRQLLSFATGIPFNQIPLQEMPPLEEFWKLIEQRATGTPVQHLTGEAPFRNLTLKVGPGVFIPRPETELLVELALPKIAGKPHPVVIDLCTGSGAIAAAIATETTANVYAVEIDETAYHYAQQNLSSTNTTLIQEDFHTALTQLNAQADLVISNPPYIPENTRNQLPPETLQDPELALFGGKDGLQLIPGLIETAARLLKPNGWLIFEHDDTHGETAPALLAANPHFEYISEHQDYTGRPRYAMAKKKA